MADLRSGTPGDDPSPAGNFGGECIPTVTGRWRWAQAPRSGPCLTHPAGGPIRSTVPQDLHDPIATRPTTPLRQHGAATRRAWACPGATGPRAGPACRDRVPGPWACPPPGQASPIPRRILAGIDRWPRAVVPGPHHPRPAVGRRDRAAEARAVAALAAVDSPRMFAHGARLVSGPAAFLRVPQQVGRQPTADETPTARRATPKARRCIRSQ